MKRPDEQPLSCPPFFRYLCSERHAHDIRLGKTAIKIFRRYTQRKPQIHVDSHIAILAIMLSIGNYHRHSGYDEWLGGFVWPECMSQRSRRQEGYMHGAFARAIQFDQYHRLPRAEDQFAG